MTNTNQILQSFLTEHTDDLVAFRRHLHAHPELSYEEHATTKFVVERLEAAGLTPKIMQIGTGLSCDIGKSTKNVVVLRADIDALAAEDEKDVHYRSQVPGVLHGCGHDVHTTIVLGAGLALARLSDELAGGTVRLIFQPAEETAISGAPRVIQEKLLKNVKMIFGLHVDPRLDVGLLGTRVGAITSAADQIEIHLRGPGGHTARPFRTVDLVNIAGRLAVELPEAVHSAPGGETLSVVFGAIHSGDACNVIPSSATLRGTARTPEYEVWNEAPRILEQTLAKVLEDTGTEFTLEHRRGVPPVMNDEKATRILEEAASKELGASSVVPTHQSEGGDDFAWYLEHVPGTYARLGVHTPETPYYDLHASTFDVDERAITVGIEVLVQAALDALEQ